MDPLSITASIIAVLQLTSKTIKYLVDVQAAPEECQSCTTELSNLSLSLISLKSRAERAERAQSHDPWFEQLRGLNVVDGPLDQYKQALELLLSKVIANKSFGKVRKRLLWKFKKEQVTSIQASIERLKSLITAALLMDHIALSEAIKADASFIRASLLHVRSDVSTLQTTARSVQNATQNIRDTTHSIQNDTKNIQNNTTNIQDVQLREQYRTVLAWLSSTDYPAQQQDILSRRQTGTAQWFLDSVEFRLWTQGSEKTLFCPGIPGAGKTMMAAVTIDYLSRTYNNDNVNVAYVFCNYKAQVDQSVSGLLAAILKQLAPYSSDTMTQLTELYDKHSRSGGKPALDELLRSILLCVTRHTTYIIIDALDECSSRDRVRDRFIENLLDLQARSNIRLLFTSRFIPEVVTKFGSDLRLEVRASEEDVRQFIQGQIRRLPGCVQRDKSLQKEIQDQIARAVDGMFLLARLHLDSVSVQTSPKKVRVKLRQLKKGSEALDEAYKDALTRIDEQPFEHRHLAQRALLWVSYAKRLLTAQELRVALAIEPGESTLDVENLDDLDDVVSFCAGLMTIDHESGVVRLVHYTTQEYLQRVRLTWAPDMQHRIAEACLSYLSFEEFRNGSCPSDAVFEQRLVHHKFFYYAATYWSDHVRPVEQFFVDSAVELLRDEDSRASIVQLVHTRDYQYSDYSKEYPRDFSALHVASHVGLCKLVQQLLTCEIDGDKNNVNQMDSLGCRPLCCASENGHEQVVKLLLEKGANINAQGWVYGSALQTASLHGHEQVVKLLLEEGADVNAQGGPYGSALQAASMHGHEQVVKLLLEKGADFNAQGGYFGSALHAASKGRHERVIKLLFEEGATVGANDDA